MIDEPKGGQYNTGFERCAEGWRLWVLATVNKSDARMAAYRAHVRDCPECLAVKGRFAEKERQNFRKYCEEAN